VTEPACAWTLMREYPRLSGLAEASRLAGQAVDLLSYLWSLHVSGRLRLDFAPLPMLVAYHRSCRLRALDPMGCGPRLLGLVPELKIRETDACCATGTVWGLQTKSRPASLLLGERAAREMREIPADRIVSESGHAALRLQELSGAPVGHPVEILHQAYGLPG
jgi:glycerol-3-phosphate dehydrogenase subunit C